VCQDSVQKRNRKSNTKKEKEENSEDSEDAKDPEHAGPVKYDCGGAIHTKFSTKRKAINVVYKHNPFHSTPAADEKFVDSSSTIKAAPVFLGHYSLFSCWVKLTSAATCLHWQ
jgi:hypothetical protein